MGRAPNSTFLFSLQPNSQSSLSRFLIPFDFGRPFFYRTSHQPPLFSTLRTQPTFPLRINIKMRFSIAAAAFMATFVAADYTSTTVRCNPSQFKVLVLTRVKSTTVIDTITSCGPEVTNCPGRISTSTLPPYVPVPTYANSSSVAPHTTSSAAGYVAPTSSVQLATTYITTCIPSVITSVYTVIPTTSAYVPPPKPSGTGSLTYAKNVT
jgi:hypothetical protein